MELGVGDGALIGVILVTSDEDRAVGCLDPSTGVVEAGFEPETSSPLDPANGSDFAEFEDNANPWPLIRRCLPSAIFPVLTESPPMLA